MRIGGIGLGEACGNGKTVLIGLQRAGEIALRLKHLANPLVGDGEIALPVGIGRIGLGKTGADGKAVLIGF